MSKRNEIKEICEKYEIEKWHIDHSGLVSVAGSVDLCNKGLTKLPLDFGAVYGNFHIHYNQLNNLEGCPKYVGGNFVCGNNELTSLKGCPNFIGGFFNDKLNIMPYRPYISHIKANCIYSYNKWKF